MTRFVWLAALVLLLFPPLAGAQNMPIYQSGGVTRGHALAGVQNGVAQDAGGAQSGNLTEIGITNKGLPNCITDVPTSSPGGYHQLCIGANATVGSATTPPGGGSGAVVGPGSSTIGHCAFWANATGNLLSDAPCLGEGVNVTAYGAKCDGVTDDTAAIKATISAAEAQGTNGIVLFPSGVCLYTPPLQIMPNSSTIGVTLRGQGAGITQLKEVPHSSADFLDVGNAAQPETDNVRVQGIEFTGNSPTGGYAISAVNVGRFYVSDVILGNTFCGIHDSRSNFDVYRNIWGNTVGTNCQAFLWDGGISRSDQLTVENIGINSGFYGNDGFVWEGLANTLNMKFAAFLQTNHGFWVNASQNTTNNFPAFASIYDLQVEGAKTGACEIDGGRYIHFTDSFCHSEYGETGPGGSQGNNDNGAFIVNPDASASNTSDISYKGGAIGISAKQAVVLNGQQIKLDSVTLRGSSLSSAEAYPSVELEHSGSSGSADYQFSNVKFCGTFGDTVQNSYGLIRDAGVGQTIITNADFNYCQTGEIQDNSTTLFNLTVSGGVDRNGNVLPFSAGTYVSASVPSVSSCGTNPSIFGNDLVGRVNVGAGSVTSCTITFASPSIGNFAGALLTPNSTAVGTLAVLPIGTPPTGMTISSSSNMAGAAIFWRVTQGAN